MVKSARSWRKSRTFGEACRHAWEGVRFAVVHERNFRIQLAVYAVVAALGVWVNLSAVAWALVLLASAFILSMELINTAIETLANTVNAAWDDQLRTVKDLAAGAVLVASISALAVGLLLFLPALL